MEPFLLKKYACRLTIPHNNYPWEGLAIEFKWMAVVNEIGKRKGQHYHLLILTEHYESKVRSVLKTFTKHCGQNINGAGKLSVKTWDGNWFALSYLYKENKPWFYGSIDNKPNETELLQMHKNSVHLSKLAEKVVKTTFDIVDKIVNKFIQQCDQQQSCIDKELDFKMPSNEVILNDIADLHLEARKILPSDRDAIRILYTIKRRIRKYFNPDQVIERNKTEWIDGLSIQIDNRLFSRY